jgi:hypothetical protein
MVFTKRLRDGARRREITCSVRIWKHPHVKVGGRYPMEEGEIEVDTNRADRAHDTWLRGKLMTGRAMRSAVMAWTLGIGIQRSCPRHRASDIGFDPRAGAGIRVCGCRGTAENRQARERRERLRGPALLSRAARGKGAS